MLISKETKLYFPKTRLQEKIIKQWFEINRKLERFYYSSEDNNLNYPQIKHLSKENPEFKRFAHLLNMGQFLNILYKFISLIKRT
jgi:hypothetical protein